MLTTSRSSSGAIDEKRHPVFHRIGLHQLESHAAARQLVERVGAIGAFRIENGYRTGNLLGGEVMVADDEIHALSLRIGYLLRGFDAAVEGDDERHALAGGVIDSLDGDTVPFGVAVGDVKSRLWWPIWRRNL